MNEVAQLMQCLYRKAQRVVGFSWLQKSAENIGNLNYHSVQLLVLQLYKYLKSCRASYQKDIEIALYYLFCEFYLNMLKFF